MNVQSTQSNRWLGLLFICISLMVISLDNTILNVALPSISRELGATASELQWIIDAYVLVFAALLLTMGAVGDRVGRKKALQFGVLMFGIGSLAAALATSTPILIAARAFLGIGGATIMPATLSIVSATFRDPKERSQAIAIWAAVFAFGVGLGPLIGGWLLEHFEWNSVFFVNLPVVVIALIGGYLYISESKDETAPAPDIPGVLLSITGLFALVYGIIEAGLHGWGAQHVLLSFAVAAVLIGIFAWWENRAPNAMLPLSFFRNMSFTGANIALALVTFALFGSTFFISQYFQSVQGFNALHSGARVVPLAIMLTICATFSARVNQRLGTKWTVGIGIMLAGIGLLYMSQVAHVDTPYTTFVIGQLILGAGMGTAMSPATNSIMSSVPINKAGIGSAMNDTTRQLGGALGVAVLGTFANNVYLNHVNSLELMNTLPADAATAIRNSIQGAHIVAEQLNNPSISPLIVNTANDAFVLGMTEAMFIGSLIMFAAAILTFAILPSEVRRAIEPEASLVPQPAIEAKQSGLD